MIKTISNDDLIIKEATRAQFEEQFPWDVRADGERASWYYFQGDLIGSYGYGIGQIFNGNTNEL